MTTDETRRYIDELKALREKYADKIRIYIGLEVLPVAVCCVSVKIFQFHVFALTF